ncbi:hypothetical protein Tco_0582958 [Tanacetum coccineum]
MVDDGDDEEMMMIMMVVVWWWVWAVVGWQRGGGGSGGVESRVGESDMGDRIDPLMRSIFGVRRKRPPKKFSGIGGVVVAGIRRRRGGRKI